MQSKEDAGATYDKANLVQTIFDLFLAGTETTATTLRWALLYMVAYPDVQGEYTTVLQLLRNSMCSNSSRAN